MTDELDNNRKDHFVALLRGAANAIPFVGGVLGELVTSVIPGQRHDRIASYLRQLDHRIAAMNENEAKLALSNPDKITLIELGGYQAARSTSENRIEHIVNVVFAGLSKADSDTIRRNRLLSLLGEIDDDEITILSAYGLSRGIYGHDAWTLINRPPPSHLGAGREIIDQNTLYELGTAHLLRLNLLSRRFSKPKKGELPEFDPDTGMMKGSVQISALGRLLLTEIGILDSSSI